MIRNNLALLLVTSALLSTFSAGNPVKNPITAVNETFGNFVPFDGYKPQDERLYEKTNPGLVPIERWGYQAKVTTSDERIAAWWAGLLDAAWWVSEIERQHGKEPPVRRGPSSRLARLGSEARDHAAQSIREQVMVDWWQAVVASSAFSPGDPAAKDYIEKVEWIDTPDGKVSVTYFRTSEEKKRELRAKREKWQNSTARVDTVILFRIYNPGPRPVSDADLTWLANSNSPFRPVAVAELRVREGLAKTSGPYTARWTTWANQHRGVLRELLVRRVKRLLTTPTSSKPAPPVSGIR